MHTQSYIYHKTNIPSKTENCLRLCFHFAFHPNNQNPPNVELLHPLDSTQITFSRRSALRENKRPECSGEPESRLPARSCGSRCGTLRSEQFKWDAAVLLTGLIHSQRGGEGEMGREGRERRQLLGGTRARWRSSILHRKYPTKKVYKDGCRRNKQH